MILRHCMLPHQQLPQLPQLPQQRQCPVRLPTASGVMLPANVRSAMGRRSCLTGPVFRRALSACCPTRRRAPAIASRRSRSSRRQQLSRRSESFHFRLCCVSRFLGLFAMLVMHNSLFLLSCASRNTKCTSNSRWLENVGLLACIRKRSFVKACVLHVCPSNTHTHTHTHKTKSLL